MKWPDIWSRVRAHYRIPEDKYFVEFDYGDPNDTEGRITTCFIYEGDARISDNDMPLASGQAYCASTDNFNRRVGRTIAFRRAFEALKVLDPTF